MSPEKPSENNREQTRRSEILHRKKKLEKKEILVINRAPSQKYQFQLDLFEGIDFRKI